MNDIRVYYVGHNPPVPTWGTSMAFYRHFAERKGFSVAVATDNPQVRSFPEYFPTLLVSANPLLNRLKRTRFSKVAYTFEHLLGGCLLPRKVWRHAQDFKPDIVIVSLSSWSWLADISQKLASRLSVPLVGSFNDWFDYYTIMAPFAKGLVERKFRRFYQSCDLALCTCEGMREALGPHRNAIVHYPIGAERTSANVPLSDGKRAPFRILYGGSLQRWYGAKLEELISTTKESGLLGVDIDFAICGSNPGWSKEFGRWAEEVRIYRGQLPFDKLQKEASKADALILLMGFGEDCAQVERTSFKTKFLDYLSFEKPIIVWGPGYSSAIRTAREFDSAETCDSSLAHECLRAIQKLSTNTERCDVLVANARTMYESRFSPSLIHQVFLSACHQVAARAN